MKHFRLRPRLAALLTAFVLSTALLSLSTVPAWTAVDTGIEFDDPSGAPLLASQPTGWQPVVHAVRGERHRAHHAQR